MTAEIIYRGDLRTEAMHLQSGNTIITDAPTDNQGKGEAFSPTDLVATALGSCMMTLMGIVAQRHQLDLSGMRASITKNMQANPRKIASIEIVFAMPPAITEPKMRQILENAARTCPVALSLDKEILQIVDFQY
jgi:putative redox protein